nr:hypothetical protein [Staphylococcus aureus]
MFKVNYSILSYYPDIYLHCNLAVGVAFEIIGEVIIRMKLNL